MVKILVTGAYCVLNKGDAALRLGGLPHIKELIPDAEFIIMTPFPEIDSKIYKDGKVVKAIDSPLKAIEVIARCTLWKILHIDKLLCMEEIHRYIKSDLVLDISGDSISEVTGFRGTIYHFLHLWISLKLNKLTIIYAQSVGPFKFTKPFAKYLLNKVDLVTLRGKRSYDYLREIGINKPPLYLTADLAFLMSSVSNERIDNIFSDYNIKGETFVGISVSDWISKYYGSYNGFAELMANVTDHIVEKLGATVIFIPHVTGPKKDFDDRIISGDVYSRIKNKDNVILIKKDFSPQETWGIIGRCNLFIGARMHACIGALSMCVPTINISYHHKSNDIMTMFGLEENVLSIQDVSYDNLISRIDYTWIQRIEIKKQIASRVGTIKRQAMLNANILYDILKDKGVLNV